MKKNDAVDLTWDIYVTFERLIFKTLGPSRTALTPTYEIGSTALKLTEIAMTKIDE